MQNSTRALAAGDLLVVAAVTVIGFATHGEAGAAVLPRMLTTFLLLSLGWLSIAYLLGLFNSETAGNPRQLWRPLTGMLFAGPLAALLRALLLNTVVLPVFAVVLSASAALGMLIWRGLWCALRRGRRG